MTWFRDMRRKRQQLSNEESIAILEKATAGTLALLGDDDFFYDFAPLLVVSGNKFVAFGNKNCYWQTNLVTKIRLIMSKPV